MSRTTNKVAKIGMAVALIGSKMENEFTRKQYEALAKGTRHNPSPYASLDLLREEDIVKVSREEEFEIEDRSYYGEKKKKTVMVDKNGNELCSAYDYKQYAPVREMAMKMNGGVAPTVKTVEEKPTIIVKKYYYSIDLDNYEKVVCRLYSQVKSELEDVNDKIDELVKKRDGMLSFLNSIEVDEDTEFWDE